MQVFFLTGIQIGTKTSLSSAAPPIFIKVTRTETSVSLGNLAEVKKILWCEELLLQPRDLTKSCCCCHCWQWHSEPSRNMGGIISCFTHSGYILTTITSSDCNTTVSVSSWLWFSPSILSTGQDNVFTVTVGRGSWFQSPGTGAERLLLGHGFLPENLVSETRH